jgi:phosphatidylserine decarboxylase
VIKGVPYNVRELLRDTELAARFAGGLALVFRLCVDDYHRYCWFDGGRAERAVHIPGVLNTVRPVALRSVPVFRENSREYTLLHSDGFGDAVQMEVGATMVGRIANLPHAGAVRRGEEKGMFMFGGSTIVLLLGAGAAELDAELLRRTEGETEVVVKMGQRIGGRIGK